MSTILDIFTSDSITIIASFCRLNEFAVVLRLSKKSRKALLQNGILWVWLSTVLVNSCGLCMEDLCVYKNLSARYWGNQCKMLMAKKRLRRQWRLNFSSRLMINEVRMSDFESFQNGRTIKDPSQLPLSYNELLVLLDSTLNKEVEHHLIKRTLPGTMHSLNYSCCHKMELHEVGIYSRHIHYTLSTQYTLSTL